MRVTLLLLLLPVFVAVADGMPAQVEKTNNASCTPFKALTYDVNMDFEANFRKGIEIARRRSDTNDALIAFLQQSDADVVCLQGIVNERELGQYTEQLSQQFPHSFNQITLFDGSLPEGRTYDNQPPFCVPEVQSDLEDCENDMCMSVDSSTLDFTTCLINNCPDEYQLLVSTGGTKCLQCNLQQQGFGSSRCDGTSTSTEYRDMNPLGLMLLSKHPLTNRQVVPFYQGIAQIKPSGYLQEKIKDKITVTCSQLSRNDLFTYEPVLSQYFSSFSEQNDYESAELLRRVKDIKKHLLLGQFNFGPGGLPNRQAVKEDVYRNYTELFNTDVVEGCTFCSENPLTAPSEASLDGALDHIFGKDLNISNSMIMFTQDQVPLPIDGGGTTPLSESYGVQATVSCNCEEQQQSQNQQKKFGWKYQQYVWVPHYKYYKQGK